MAKGLSAALTIGLCAGQVAAQEESPFQALKDIPVAQGTTLSMGGELRERFEALSNPDFGLGGVSSDAYLLQRATVSAELKAHDTLTAFVQLGSWVSTGREPERASTDDDGLDLAQGYIDLAFDAAGGEASLRPGRQELSYGSSRLISVREGANIRRVFDGGRGRYTIGDASVDAFWAQPVRLDDGAFDNRTNLDERIWGVYGTLPVSPSYGLKADLYYLAFKRERGTFGQGTAQEDRDTIGFRLFGKSGPWDWDLEAAYQFGDFGSRDISAWTATNEVGYSLPDVTWKPRLSMKGGVASGDRNAADGRLGTFNAMYPKLPYFSEATLVAPANLVEVQPVLTVSPAKDVELSIGWEFLWRHQPGDAFYTSPMSPITGTQDGDRYAGNQIQIAAAWKPTHYLEIRAWYVRFHVGDTLEKVGADDVDFAAVSTSVKF